MGSLVASLTSLERYLLAAPSKSYTIVTSNTATFGGSQNSDTSVSIYRPPVLSKLIWQTAMHLVTLWAFLRHLPNTYASARCLPVLPLDSCPPVELVGCDELAVALNVLESYRYRHSKLLSQCIFKFLTTLLQPHRGGVCKAHVLLSLQRNSR